jgi:hypothetical protein
MAIKTVSITGGEPFFELSALTDLSSALAEQGAGVTVITSAFWATSERKAREVLTRIPGVQRLVISFDRFHEEWVPRERIRHAYLTARALNMEAHVRLVRAAPPTDTDIELSQYVESFAENDDIEYQRLISYGRASQGIAEAGYSSSRRERCPSTGPHIGADGAVTPCCNSIISIEGPHPLVLANVTEETPRQIRDNANNSLLLLMMRVLGATWIREILRNGGAAVNVPTLDDMSVCDLCFVACRDPDSGRCLADWHAVAGNRVKLYTLAVRNFGLEVHVPALRDALQEVLLQRQLDLPRILPTCENRD